MIALTILCVLNTVAIAVSFYLLYPPSNRTKAYMTSLEREKSGWKINETELKSKCRLLESEKLALIGRCSGHDEQMQAMEQEVAIHKAMAAEAYEKLIAAGVVNG